LSPAVHVGVMSGNRLNDGRCNPGEPIAQGLEDSHCGHSEPQAQWEELQDDVEHPDVDSGYETGYCDDPDVAVKKEGT